MSDRRLLDMAAVVVALFVSTIGSAATRLECTLKNVETQTDGAYGEQIENKVISIVFDESAKAVTLYLDGNPQVLHNVTITQQSISGAGADNTIGVDRSSWSVVLQTYAPGSTRAEFGSCNPTPTTTAS